jgi:hypothetical protein
MLKTTDPLRKRWFFEDGNKQGNILYSPEDGPWRPKMYDTVINNNSNKIF